MELQKAETIVGVYMDRIRAAPCETTCLSPIEYEAFLSVIRANDEKLADLLSDPDAKVGQA